MIRIALNGFGRIGKNFLRAFLQNERARKKIEVSAINVGPGNPEFVAHEFKYDTLLGRYTGDARIEKGVLVVDDYAIPIIAECDPKKLPWRAMNIDWVVEATGHFTKREGAQGHIQAGANKVLITAPARDEDITIIPGVNMSQYDATKHSIVSLGSCSTNAFVPMSDVLNRAFGIKYGFIATTHAYTNTQALLDVDIGDPRRNRAAALNIVPTSTGATKLMGRVIPELEGKIQGHALRVPVAKVSLADFVFEAERPLSIKAIHEAFEDASEGSMRGILALTMEPLVSSDYSCNSHSVVIDGQMTQVCGPLAKVYGWYDNEWAYSVRLIDFLSYVTEST
ncbi:type I glyceraldehyde-3-phosphate dehydrogenase [Candidatus Babeliales bacterium]|nr:type I glyceraldehyde-3-phosphate dehydrogenase [Candidatus Babeliales bacterium]